MAAYDPVADVSRSLSSPRTLWRLSVPHACNSSPQLGLHWIGWASRAVCSRHGFEDDAERRATGQRKLNAELKRSAATNPRLC